MKGYHLDLVRVTEAGAIAAAKWVGRGNKESADKDATEAIRNRLNRLDFLAEVAIGEGEKDESYGLYYGELVGEQRNELIDPQYSIAVDPIEGTTPTAKGGYEAMSVIALGKKDSFFKTDSFYMNKIAVGPKIAKKVKISLVNSVQTNISLISAALNKKMEHITVCVLDRSRHDDLVAEIRNLGCRIKFITDCDVTACIACCERDSGVDVYWGIGGSPEGVIAAAAMKCMGGFLQCQLCDKKGDEFVVDNSLLEIEDLAKGDVMFSATGITNGKLLKGVAFTSRGPITHSITMRSGSGTVRRIITQHGN